MVTFAGIMLVYAAALLSVIPLRRRLHPILIACGYWVSVILFEQLFTVLSLNLRMLEIAPGPFAVWSCRLYGLTLYPAALLWSAAILSGRASRPVKIVTIPLFVGLMILFDYILFWAGWLVQHRWIAAYSLIRHSVIIVILLSVLAGIRQMLRKGASAP